MTAARDWRGTDPPLAGTVAVVSDNEEMIRHGGLTISDIANFLVLLDSNCYGFHGSRNKRSSMQIPGIALA